MSEKGVSEIYKLRKATEEDLEFLYNLNKITMKKYYEEVFGKWNDVEQEKFFKEGFTNEEYEIILVDEKNTGCLCVRKNSKEIFIYDILILPEQQSKGIGKDILYKLISEGKKSKVPVKLEVIKVNFIAKRFYEKIGFKLIDENKTHYIMIKNFSINDES